jgi:type VI secretion system protein ImpL
VQGAVAEAYANVVLPACKAASQDRFPFFAAAAGDAGVLDTVRFFGMGGMMDAFVRERLMPMLDVGGPIWRWRLDDPVAATLDPASANEFAKASQIRDLLAAGLSFKISLETLGVGADAVEFSSGGTTYRFDAAMGAPRPMLWSPQAGVPEARVTFFKGPQKLDEVQEEGPWAVFRLMDKARRQNAGPSSFLASFGDGDVTGTLRITLATEQNPFSRGGVWTFRCPVTL